MSFTSVAYAAGTQAVTDSTAGGSFGSAMILVVFALFFYFLLWRPQSQRAKEQRNMLAQLAKGDEVIISGGLLGKVSKISGDFILLTVAENIDLRCQKSAVVTVLPKGTFKSID